VEESTFPKPTCCCETPAQAITKPWSGEVVSTIASTRAPIAVIECCDRKAQAACALSFTLWQQATIEITRRDHSIIACSRHIYMGVVLRAHPVRGESHIQRNANQEVATKDAKKRCNKQLMHLPVL